MRLYVVKDASIVIKGVTVAKGDMIVNGRPAENYFQGDIFKKMYQEAFRTTNTLGRFAVSVTTTGGGTTGQLGAVIHGISRALIKVDLEKFRPILKKRGFLTRDPRAKERPARQAAHAAGPRNNLLGGNVMTIKYNPEGLRSIIESPYAKKRLKNRDAKVSCSCGDLNREDRILCCYPMC